MGFFNSLLDSARSKGGSVELKVTTGDLHTVDAKVLILFHFEGEETRLRATEAANKATGGMIGRVVAAGDFRGEHLEHLLLYVPGGLAAERMLGRVSLESDPSRPYELVRPDGSPFPAGEGPERLALRGETLLNVEALVTRADAGQPLPVLVSVSTWSAGFEPFTVALNVMLDGDR